MVEGGFQAKSFPHDGDEDVDRDGDPDLGLDGVLAGAEEGFDAEMLLDPLEEEFDLPALLVDLRDGQRGQREVVGEELESLAGYWVAIADAAQRVRVGRSRGKRGQDDRLIRTYPCALVGRMRIPALQQNVLFRPRDEERGAEREAIEPLEIEVAAVHDIVGSGLDLDPVEGMDIVQFSVGNMQKSRDIAVKIEQRVQFDAAFFPCGIWPMETERGRDRWWSNRARRGWRLGPRQARRPRKEVLRRRSDAARSRRRCASRGARWRRPVSSVSRARESPYDTACRRRLRGKPRCLAGSRGRSVGRTPWPETGPGRRSRDGARRPDTAKRISETRTRADNPRSGRTQSFRHSSPIVKNPSAGSPVRHPGSPQPIQIEKSKPTSIPFILIRMRVLNRI